MEFKRKFYEELLEWKKTYAGKNAMLIEGARRIGKSTIAEAFAKNEYKDYILLDFAKENSDVKNLFVENLSDMDVFFNNLFVLKQKELVPRQSVIILDEIQLYPQARQAIKYLVQDGRFDYIETGSLITIKKKSAQILIPSEEHRRKMYPMDFEEFLWAFGDTVTAKAIKERFESRKPFGDALHRKNNANLQNLSCRWRNAASGGGVCRKTNLHKNRRGKAFHSHSLRRGLGKIRRREHGKNFRDFFHFGGTAIQPQLSF